MSPPEFRAFQRIPRLRREIIITEKIDGTNAIVHVGEDGTVTAGSRNRWLTAEHDNYGFHAWVMANAEELKRLGPGYHYGEWWGAGIQRRYNINEKRFSLFNVERWSDPATRPGCCWLVPILYRGTYDSNAVDFACERLRASGSVAAPGFMNPEGIVVYHCASRTLAKFTLDGDGHKGEKK